MSSSDSGFARFSGLVGTSSPSAPARAGGGLRRALGTVGVVLAALSVLRCAAPDECVRGSDCEDGWACISGTCKKDGLEDVTKAMEIAYSGWV